MLFIPKILTKHNMKKLQTLLAVVLLGGAAANAQTQADTLSTISVQWSEPQAKEMGLYKVENCALVPIATSQVIDGKLAFAFHPDKEGYYAIAKHPRSSMYRYIFYLKPGDDLSFSIEGDDYTLTDLDGITNTPENRAIAAWQDLVHPLEAKAIYFMGKISTFRDFFPLFEQMQPQIKAFPKANTPNARFNASFENYKRFNLAEIANMLLQTPRTEHPKAADFIAYYKQDYLPELTSTTAILDYPRGLDVIENCYINPLRADTSLSEKDFIQKRYQVRETLLTGNTIVNDTVRGEFITAAFPRNRRQL